MEATLGQTIQFATSIDGDKLGRKPGGLFQFYSRPRPHKRLLFLSSVHSQHGRTCASSKDVSLKEASHSCRHSPGSVWQSGSFLASFDEAKILKNKSEEIEPYLDGRCIYLVGMMGSGKTTVGKILSESLGYSFYDCDALIEQSVGGVPVKEIFKLHGESFFRDNETEALRKLSSMHRLVVSTGGGAVVRPINWKYMHKGISVWLDVPLKVLAKRVAADGTQSRPLLHQESGDAYSRAYTQLTTLMEERGEAYENANARVCFRHIVAKLGGYLDVFNPTPAVIAIEVLDRIEGFLKR